MSFRCVVGIPYKVGEAVWFPPQPRKSFLYQRGGAQGKAVAECLLADDLKSGHCHQKPLIWPSGGGKDKALRWFSIRP